MSALVTLMNFKILWRTYVLYIISFLSCLILYKKTNKDNLEEVLAKCGNQLQFVIKIIVIYLCTDTCRKGNLLIYNRLKQRTEHLHVLPVS